LSIGDFYGYRLLNLYEQDKAKSQTNPPAM